MPVKIHKALESQEELKNSKEKASISRQMKNRHGIEVGQQIRIQNLENNLTGAFTVWEIHDSPDKPIRMAQRARKKTFNTKSPFVGTLSTTVPDNELSYQQAWRHSRAVETTWHEPLHDHLIAVAPHGGDMEAYTDQIAIELFKNLPEGRCSMWAFHGFGDNAGDRFHIKSGRVHPNSYPGLAKVADADFRHAISFHVKKDAEVMEVGGLASRSAREDIADTLRDAVNDKWETVVDYEEGKYMAETEANVVNWLTEDRQSGIQIEFPIDATRNYRKRIARRLSDYYF